MKFKIILLTLIFFSSAYLRAQCSLSGTIIDLTDKTPIAGAIIYIPDLKKGTATDLEGKYSLNDLPNGKYLAEIKQIGYSSISRVVNACETPKQDFSLSSSVVETKEVVIAGSSKATELLKMPGAVTTIDHSTLFKTTSTNIIDALTSKPGITQITTGAGVSKPVIRGLGYNRIITLNDGVRQEGQQWGDEHGIEIDEFSANKIEILKGPASLMYGSDAMAGVINILSVPTLAEGVIKGNIAANYQTNNGLSAISAMNNGNLKGISWMIRSSYKNAGNYSNKYDGKVYNSGFNELDFSGNLGLNRKWGYSHLLFSSFNQNLGLVEGERDSATGKFLKEIKINDTLQGFDIATTSDLSNRKLFIPYQKITHQKIASDNTFILGKSRLSVLLAYQKNIRKEFGDILNPELAGLIFSLKTFSGDIKYFLPEKNKWQITFGANSLVQQNNNLGLEYIIPEYKQLDAGVFAYFKKDFTEKLNLSGGLRFDSRSYESQELIEEGKIRFEHSNKKFSNISGSLGSTYELTKATVIKLNIARGYRAPQAAELSSNGRHEGTFRFELGNSELKAETSLQGDLGILFNSEHVSVDAALFSNNISNFIYLEKLNSVNGGDSISDDSDPAPTFKFVQGNAALNGAELGIDIHPHPLDWLHFESTFSYVNAVNRNQSDSSKYLPFTPATRITSELRADFKKLNSNFMNFYFLINAQIYLQQDHVLLENRAETLTPGYTLFNAATGCDIKNKKNKLICSLVLAANNITDIAYQSHLSRLKYAPLNYATGRSGVYNMGRNISLKVLVPLSFKG